MPHYRIAEAAARPRGLGRHRTPLGRFRSVACHQPRPSHDRRGRARRTCSRDSHGTDLGTPVAESARNRFTGLVTRVIKDSVMAQVDMQCGPFRVVSLMSAEAATELQLEPGVLAVASVKSTHVVVEVPADL